MSVLVIDDDGDLLDVLSYLLRRDGYDVIPAHNGVAGFEAWQTGDPELVMLASELPQMSGWQVCEKIRAESDTPIIILGRPSDEDAMLRGLELGADDYITKPFAPRQLLARVRAVLRRAHESLDGPRKGRQLLHAGDLLLDPQFRTVERDSAVVTLTPTEFKLLYELVLHEGQVLTPSVLTDRVWGYVAVDDTTVVKGQIFNLRRKLEPDAAHPLYIHTVAGSGYVFRQPPGLNEHAILPSDRPQDAAGT
jgi:DNA-binding response OmpR family regulator